MKRIEDRSVAQGARDAAVGMFLRALLLLLLPAENSFFWRLQYSVLQVPNLQCFGDLKPTKQPDGFCCVWHPIKLRLTQAIPGWV